MLETSEYRWARKVAKLNMNVVTVCLALGLSPSKVGCAGISLLWGVLAFFSYFMGRLDLSLLFCAGEALSHPPQPLESCGGGRGAGGDGGGEGTATAGVGGADPEGSRGAEDSSGVADL